MQFIRAACTALLLGLLLLPCITSASPFRNLLAQSQQDTSSQEGQSEEDQSNNNENPKSQETTTQWADSAVTQEETNTKGPVSVTQGVRGDLPEVIVNLAPDTTPRNVEKVENARSKKSPYCVQVQSSPHSPPQTICDHHSSALAQDAANLVHHDADPLHHLAQAAIASAALGAAAHTFYQHPEHQPVSMTMVPTYNAAQPAKLSYQQPAYNPLQVYSQQQVYSSPQAYAPQMYSTPQVYSSPQTHGPQVFSAPQAHAPQVYSSPQANAPQVYSAHQASASQSHAPQEFSAPQTSAPQAYSAQQASAQQVYSSSQPHAPQIYSTPSIYQQQPQTYSAPYKPSAPSTDASSSQHSSGGSYRSASNYGAVPVIQTIPSNYGSSSYNPQYTGGTSSYNSAPSYGNIPSYQSPNYASNPTSHSAPSSYSSSSSQQFSASADENVPQHSTSYGNQGVSYTAPAHQASNVIQNSPSYNLQSTHPAQFVSYAAPPMSLTQNYGYQPAPFYNNPSSCPPPVYGHPGDMPGPQSFKLMPSYTAAGVTEKYRESESEKKDLKDGSDVTEKPSGRASEYSPPSIYHPSSSSQKGSYGQPNLQSSSFTPSSFHFQVPSAYNSQGYGGSSYASPMAYGSNPSYYSASPYSANPSYTTASNNYAQIPSNNIAAANYAPSSYGTAPMYSPAPFYGSSYSYGFPPTNSPSYGNKPPPSSYSAAPSYNYIAPSYYPSPSYAPSYSPAPQYKSQSYGSAPSNIGVSYTSIPAPSYGYFSTHGTSHNPAYNSAPTYSTPSYNHATPSYSVPVAPSYTATAFSAPQPYGPQSYSQTMTHGSGSYGYGQPHNAMPLSISCQVQPISTTQPQNYPPVSYRDSETTETSQKGKDGESGSSEESHESTKTERGFTTAKPGDDIITSSTSKPDILSSINQAIDQANPNKDKPRTQLGGQPSQPGGEARPQGGTSSLAPTGRADQWSQQAGGGWPGHQGPGRWQMMHQTNAAPPTLTRFPAPPFPQFGPEYY